eukprot:TRINITY_DN15976_c0_g1_i2.p2 TRINITY_DN15976_c0_g1~~TRINITY_DN15976_c0_g1_i2.p2  ORF type:complete len:353 (+),score=64.05 TRINITY_DN15976_c0_g1_i2:1706-2764(+)
MLEGLGVVEVNHGSLIEAAAACIGNGNFSLWNASKNSTDVDALVSGINLVSLRHDAMKRMIRESERKRRDEAAAIVSDFKQNARSGSFSGSMSSSRRSSFVGGGGAAEAATNAMMADSTAQMEELEKTIQLLQGTVFPSPILFNCPVRVLNISNIAIYASFQLKHRDVVLISKGAGEGRVCPVVGVCEGFLYLGTREDDLPLSVAYSRKKKREYYHSVSNFKTTAMSSSKPTTTSRKSEAFLPRKRAVSSAAHAVTKTVSSSSPTPADFNITTRKEKMFTSILDPFDVTAEATRRKQLNLREEKEAPQRADPLTRTCLLYTSDAADEEDSVDLGGRRIIKKKKNKKKNNKQK